MRPSAGSAYFSRSCSRSAYPRKRCIDSNLTNDSTDRIPLCTGRARRESALSSVRPMVSTSCVVCTDAGCIQSSAPVSAGWRTGFPLCCNAPLPPPCRFIIHSRRSAHGLLHMWMLRIPLSPYFGRFLSSCVHQFSPQNMPSAKNSLQRRRTLGTIRMTFSKEGKL